MIAALLFLVGWLSFAAPAAAGSGLLLLGASGGAAAVATPPLDGLTAPLRAYSMRRLLTAYATNKAVNIVRASDSATTDVGFVSNVFDTASAVTFCAATTCKVVTWYDQSGATANLTQATDGSRPALTFNCVGSIPCVQTTTTQSMAAAANITPATGLMSFSLVANRETAAANNCTYRGNGNANRVAARTSVANSWFGVVGGTSGSITVTANDAAWHAINSVLNGASSVANVDGVETTGTATGSTAAGAPGVVGVATTTCDVVEFVIWDNYALSAGERTALKNGAHTSFGF